MYAVKYSEFRKQWLVINQFNGLSQSGWSNRIDALRVKKTLNVNAIREMMFTKSVYVPFMKSTARDEGKRLREWEPHHTRTKS